MVWMYDSLCNHVPVEGQLDCFQFLAIMNKAALNIHLQVFFCEHKPSVLGINVQEGTARSYGSSYTFSYFFNCQIIFQGGGVMLSKTGMLLIINTLLHSH